MKTLRTFSLRTQFAVIVAFLVVFALGAGVSHWVRSESQAGLAIAMHADLAIATKLPRLKALLRELDLAAAQYLRTGRPDWLRERRDILDRISATQKDLYALVPEGRERLVLEDLDRQLRVHHEEESRWIERRRAGALRPEEAAKVLSGRRSYEDVLEIALNMHDIDLRAFAGRSEAAHRASLRGFWLVLFVGLLASAALSLGLSRYVIEPIRSLDEYARGWTLGEPWACQVPSVSPEIDSLFRGMKSLADRLNAEYQKEKDIGRFKSQLVSTVSHELNNSLSVINIAAFALEDSEPEPRSERRGRMLRTLRAQAVSLSKTVSNLLNLGRLESGRLALDKRRTDLGAVLRESVELMAVLAENKRISVAVEVPDSPLPVYADPEALSLVVTNLLNNAVKYTHEGGSVRAGIAREGGSVRVSVRDTGIGIAPEERELVFSGGYRAERGKRLAKGFGIGLSLARSIVAAHGGRLELESAVGEGSTFSFTLPLWAPDGRS